MLTPRPQLIAATELFCDATSMSVARLSTLLFGRGTRLTEILDGGDLKTETWVAAMQWLSDNWPDGADWPEDVARPEPKAKAVAP